MLRKYCLPICLLFTAISCGGNLTEKERKALQEEMQQREIRQVRDDEILNEALLLGRRIRESGSEADSLMNRLNARVEIYMQAPEDSLLLQLWDAYKYGFESGQEPEDNVQRAYPDNLIYTTAESTSDSSFQMKVLWLPKKGVIQSLL